MLYIAIQYAVFILKNHSCLLFTIYKLLITSPHHDLNLIPLPQFHPFQQLCQNGALARDGCQVKLVGPTEELIVVLTDLLNRGTAGIVLQQRGVLIFCLLYLSFSLLNQVGERGFREGALPIQAADDLFLVPLLLVLGSLNLLLDCLLFAVQLGVLLADALFAAPVVRFLLDPPEHLVDQGQHDPPLSARYSACPSQGRRCWPRW